MRIIIAIATIIATLSISTDGQPAEFKQNARFYRSVTIDSTPRATNPRGFMVKAFSSDSNKVKEWDIDSFLVWLNDTLNIDTVPYSDTALYAHDAGHADTASIAQGFLHGVTPGTIAKAITESTLGNSSISEYNDTEFVYGTSDTVKDLFQRNSNPMSGKWSNCDVDLGIFRTFIDINGEGWAACGSGGGVSVYDSTFLNDQYSKAYIADANNRSGLGVRVSVSNCGQTGYFFSMRNYYSGYDTLYKKINGVKSVVSVSPLMPQGYATLWLVAKGDTVKGYDSRYSTTVPAVSILDNSISGGSPAIWADGNNSGFVWWMGGSYASSSVVSTEEKTIVKNSTIFQKKVDIERVDTITAPEFVMCQRNGIDKELKKVSIPSLRTDIDSVRAANTARKLYHGVTTGTVPVASDDSSFTDSHISENGDTTKVTILPAESDTFVKTTTRRQGLRTLCVAPNGDVYFFENEPYDGSYLVLKQTGGEGSIVDIGGPTAPWTGATATPNGDIWACSYTASNTGHVWRMAGGTGDLTEFSGHADFWDLASDFNGTVYASCNNDTIYRSVDTGAFAAWIYLNDAIAIECGKNGDLYAVCGSPRMFYCIPYGTTTLIQVSDIIIGAGQVGLGVDTSGNVFLSVNNKVYSRVGGIGPIIEIQTLTLTAIAGKINGDVYGIKQAGIVTSLDTIFLKTSSPVKCALSVFGGSSEFDGKVFANGISTSISPSRLVVQGTAPDNELKSIAISDFTADSAAVSGNSDLLDGKNPDSLDVDSARVSGVSDLSDSTVKIPTILGGIHHHDDTTTISVPTGDGYTKLTIFPQTANHSNMTCDTANDQQILTINGYYYCNARVTCYAGTAGVNIRPVLFLNESEQDQTHDETNFTTANQKQRIFCSGLIHVVDAPDTLTLRVRHDNGGSVNLSCTYGNMVAIFEGQ